MHEITNITGAFAKLNLTHRPQCSTRASLRIIK